MNREMDEFVAYHMGLVTHFIHNTHSHKLSDYDVTRAQAKALYLLSRFGDLTQSELQKRLYIKASTMNGIVESMLKKDLIIRSLSQTDRRTKVISLTASGAELEEKLWLEIINLEKDLMEGFSKEEQSLIISWLKRMKTNLEEKSLKKSKEKEGETE
ncbi:MarR family winged helix-turn-helix transcriptional regulator [Salipaludibacillus aurantiacus]|uniref:DNA-binding transcriptional regulator, MarR family n=1 Tax=Salipaludibacillus aurantiacus TaxID=1601833 RepID=A0A1H9WSE0_9BACI|nr:MarR family transcriptional regulator [Salipaludibacillus aurantiacus]SES36846.1 DNA-binding transcriptional regulator, MarR family [Salipaludibacillus aurantiacus]